MQIIAALHVVIVIATTPDVIVQGALSRSQLRSHHVDSLVADIGVQSIRAIYVSELPRHVVCHHLLTRAYRSFALVMMVRR